MATYTNKITNEIYKLGGVKDIAQAWSLSFVCSQMNWNNDMFASDVIVSMN